MKKLLIMLMILTLALTFTFAGVGAAYADISADVDLDIMATTMLGTALPEDEPGMTLGHPTATENSLPLIGPSELVLIPVYIPQEILNMNVTEPAALTLDEVKEMLAATTIKAKTRNVDKAGKSVIEVDFTVNGEIKLDGIEVYRSLSKNSGYGKKAFFTTKNSTYVNTKVTMGKRYFYKVKGYVEVEGKKYYTAFSNVAYRVVRPEPVEKYFTPKALYVDVYSDGGATTPEIAGGFTPAEDKTVTAELQAMFDEAMKDLLGVSYEPVELVATQVVAGINYKFLCNSKVVYPGAETVQKYVTITKNLDGTATLLKIEDIE